MNDVPPCGSFPFLLQAARYTSSLLVVGRFSRRRRRERIRGRNGEPIPPKIFLPVSSSSFQWLTSLFPAPILGEEGGTGGWLTVISQGGGREGGEGALTSTIGNPGRKRGMENATSPPPPLLSR